MPTYTNDFGETWTEDDAPAPAPVQQQWGSTTRDPMGGNWGLPDGDWLDRYPSDVQEVIKANWNARQGGQQAPPAAAPAPVGGGPGNEFFDANGHFNGDYQGYFNSLFPGDTLTQDALRAHEADLKKAGIDLVTSASGNTAWIRYPGSNGDIDVIGDVGGANKKQWGLPGSGGGGGGQLGGNMGSLLTPWDGSDFAANAPRLDLPEFAAPTGDEVLRDDPGFEFRKQQGEKALLQNRASRQVLNTGGTMKDLLDYGQSAASQEFDNAFNRRVSGYNLNKDRRVSLYDSAYKNYINQYNMFRQRQQDTGGFLNEQQRIGLQANQ